MQERVIVNNGGLRFALRLCQVVLLVVHHHQHLPHAAILAHSFELGAALALVFGLDVVLPLLLYKSVGQSEVLGQVDRLLEHNFAPGFLLRIKLSLDLEVQLSGDLLGFHDEAHGFVLDLCDDSHDLRVDLPPVVLVLHS